MYYQQPSQANGMGIGSIILGIISLLCIFLSCCGFGWIGILFAVIGLIIGVVGFFQSANSGHGMGLSITGITLNSIGAIIAIIIALFFATIFAGVFGKAVHDAKVDAINDMNKIEQKSKSNEEREKDKQASKNIIELPKKKDVIPQDQKPEPKSEPKPEIKQNQDVKHGFDLNDRIAVYKSIFIAKHNAEKMAVEKFGHRPRENDLLLYRVRYKDFLESEEQKLTNTIMRDTGLTKTQLQEITAEGLNLKWEKPKLEQIKERD
jgi:hypothetical protein